MFLTPAEAEFLKINGKSLPAGLRDRAVVRTLQRVLWRDPEGLKDCPLRCAVCAQGHKQHQGVYTG